MLLLILLTVEVHCKWFEDNLSGAAVFGDRISVCAKSCAVRRIFWCRFQLKANQLKMKMERARRSSPKSSINEIPIWSTELSILLRFWSPISSVCQPHGPKILNSKIMLCCLVVWCWIWKENITLLFHLMIIVLVVYFVVHVKFSIDIFHRVSSVSNKPNEKQYIVAWPCCSGKTSRYKLTKMQHQFESPMMGGWSIDCHVPLLNQHPKEQHR